MMFTIESILGDKLSKRSTTRTEPQKHSSENDDGGLRADASATESAEPTLQLRTPQPRAAGSCSSRKRKSLSDGEDEDNDSGITYCAGSVKITYCGRDLPIHNDAVCLAELDAS